MKRKKSSEPWSFIPANDDTRYNFPVGAGSYYGTSSKAKIGKLVSSSMISPPEDKTSGFKKPITQA